MGWSHNQLYCSSRKDAGCSGNSQFFYPLQFDSKYLCDLIPIPLLFEAVSGCSALIRQHRDWWLHPLQSLTNHPYTHAALSGLKRSISMYFNFHREGFVLRNSRRGANTNFAQEHNCQAPGHTWICTTNTQTPGCQTRSKSGFTEGASPAHTGL